MTKVVIEDVKETCERVQGALNNFLRNLQFEDLDRSDYNIRPREMFTYRSLETILKTTRGKEYHHRIESGSSGGPNTRPNIPIMYQGIFQPEKCL